MRAQGGGWILNIGSSTVELPAGPPFDAFASGGGLTLYASMKAALHRLTRGLAAEVHADGIAVNCVGPVGTIATPGVVAAGVIPTDMPGITEPIELIAEAALYLCSGEPRERTGFVGYTRPLLAEAGVPVRSLDGATVASDDPAHVPG